MTFRTDRALAVANAIRNALPGSFDMRFYYATHGELVNPDEPDDVLLEYLEERDAIDPDTPIVTGGLGPCGTVGCIAGWTVSLFHDALLEQTGHDHTFGDDWEMNATELLGLTEDEAYSLFMGRWFFGGMSSITRTDAADQLEYLVEHYNTHGVVDL